MVVERRVTRDTCLSQLQLSRGVLGILILNTNLVKEEEGSDT